MKIFSASLVSVLLFMALVAPKLAAGPPLPASSPARANLAGAGNSFLPVMTPDGRYLVFVSQANNLTPEAEPLPYLDVFVRDLLTGTTTLVSANAAGNSGGRGNSTHPSISGDGRWISFQSDAEDLVTNDVNKLTDVFVRNLASGATRLVSVNAQGTASGSGSSLGEGTTPGSIKPVISPDGRWVIFESSATDLVTNDNNQIRDIFARDLQAESTVLVSTNARQAGNPYPDCYSATPSADAQRVAFVSTAYDLVQGAANALGAVYVRNLAANWTSYASHLNNFPGFGNAYRCFNPAISADGRFVAFKAASADLPGQVWVLRFGLAGQLVVIATNSLDSTWPAISADGRRVALEIADQLYVWDAQTGSNVLVNLEGQFATHLYAWDAQTGTNLLVSVNAAGDGPGNGISHTPVMTPDGNHIAFLSSATNLATDPVVPAASGFQLYVRDLSSGITRLVSAGASGQASVRSVEGILPALSADGERIAFDSTDDTLVPDDLNQASDVFIRDLAANTTALVSCRSESLPARTGAAPITPEPPALGGNGRFVAFTSADSNLVPGDTNKMLDVFRRDLDSGATWPVSLGTSAPDTGDINTHPVLSADGQFVLFLKATAQIGGGPLGAYRLFWQDIQAGLTEEVDPGLVYALLLQTEYTQARAYYANPAISPDGRWVAYYASHPEVSPQKQLFLRDMVARTNTLLSAKGGCTNCALAGGNKASLNPLFSPDGRWVVFQSAASDLISNQVLTAAFVQLYARDLTANLTYPVSVDATGPPLLAGISVASAFSASNRFVAFHQADVTDSPKNTWSNYRGYLYNFQTQVTTQVCTNCLNLSPSADARWVAFERIRIGTTNDICLKDLQTGQEILISTNGTGFSAANGTSTSPLISPDGRFVVFASQASNLVPNDTNNCLDIFVYDRNLGVVLLVSPSRQGTGAGNGPSSLPVMSADGTTVAFQSRASDLVPGDYNDALDVFVLRLTSADSDNDGLPDDWEVAFFGDLSRDGSGDYDHDGLTDRQEYLAGTDPTDKGSVLQVLTLQSLSGGPVTLLWSSAPGKTYRVEYKDDVTTSWASLPGTITATDITASAQDISNAPQRFYRVVLAP